MRTEQSNPVKLQSLLNLVNLWSNFKVGSRTTGFDQIRLIREVLIVFCAVAEPGIYVRGGKIKRQDWK